MKIKTTIALFACAGLLASCSQISQSVKSVTKFGGQGDESYKASEQSNLIVPPALALPAGTSSASGYQQPAQSAARPASVGNKNYYVVVGTYPDSEKAMDTFIRLSSIGLPNATMESRQTKTGRSLHMVRLGPFKRQAQIDKVKESLTSDGLTQFKVVES